MGHFDFFIDKLVKKIHRKGISDYFSFISTPQRLMEETALGKMNLGR